MSYPNEVAGLELFAAIKAGFFKPSMSPGTGFAGARGSGGPLGDRELHEVSDRGGYFMLPKTFFRMALPVPTGS